MVRLIILFLLLSFSSFGQTVQEAFSGYGDIQTITGSGPTYTITINPFIGNPKFQPNGQYNGTEVSVGNVIWADCSRYVIASIVSTSYASMTVTATVPATDWSLGITPPNPNQRVAILTEIDGIPILPPTADGNGGALSSIDNVLYACILAHQTKQLLTGKNSVNEITDYVGTTDVPPSPPASSYAGETWRNSVGEFYYSNGTQWLSDKEVKLTNTSLQGQSTGRYKIGIDTLGKDTMYLANNGIFRRFEAGGSNISFQLTTPPLGDLEITDGGGTLSVPILNIAPIQSITGSNEISVSPSPGGSLSLDMPSQGASLHDIFRWDGSAWKPSTFYTQYPLIGNATPSDPIKLDDGLTAGDLIMWDGADWTPQYLTTDNTLAGNGWLSTPLKLAQQGATTGQVLKWNGTTWLPSTDAGITGSGTANYIPKWATSTSFANSNWYINGANTGVNTTTPAKLLDIRQVAIPTLGFLADDGGIYFTRQFDGIVAGSVTRDPSSTAAQISLRYDAVGHNFTTNAGTYLATLRTGTAFTGATPNTADGVLSIKWISSNNFIGQAGGTPIDFYMDMVGATVSAMRHIRSARDPQGVGAISSWHYGTTTSNVEVARLTTKGSLALGMTAPTATLHIKAGIATANTAPIKFTVTGAALNTTPEVGAWEVDNANRAYYTGASGARNTIAYLSDITATVSMKEESFTATAAQTTFTIAYSAPAPSGTSMPIRVYRNGVRLKYVASGPTSTQFTYTTTTVTTSANAAGDIITIEYLN